MNSEKCNINGVECTSEELIIATKRAILSENDVLEELQLMRKEAILSNRIKNIKSGRQQTTGGKQKFKMVLNMVS